MKNSCISDGNEIEAILRETGAVFPCPTHGNSMMDRCDDDANVRAFELATLRWKAGDIVGEYEDVMRAIKLALDNSAYHCPRCERFNEFDA